MPELPEVETSRLGLSPHLIGARVKAALVRNSALRWPVPSDLHKYLAGSEILGIERRGKYLLVAFHHGHLMIHLGMSGSLTMVESRLAPGKHDHVDINLDSGLSLRFNDPRRFGCVLWVEGEPEEHALLNHLGPEPLSETFTGQYLHDLAGKKTVAVKNFLMDSQVVVGVGNIYANEALFISGIRPLCKSGRISVARYEVLVAAVRSVLSAAIKQGGTTLRDFVGGDGKPGYFKQRLQVYGRGGLPCRQCGRALKEVRLANRSTVYCTQCQH